ncbi:MAG: hypothetical protein JKX83_03745, partial [Pseudomonadales bacterium]|nr:hypothetical protein [Pseudomonadales bacterium]
LKLMQQMLDRKKEEEISYLHKIDALIDLNANKKLLGFSSKILALTQIKIKNGFALQTELDEWSYRMESSKQTVEFFEADSAGLLSVESRNFLNEIENIELKPVEYLTERAVTNSIPLQIQNTFIEMGQFFPGWKDNLQVKVFIEQRKPYSGFNGGSNDTNQVAGVRVRIPIDLDNKRDRLIELDEQLYIEQKMAVKERLKQRVNSVVRQLGFKQKKLRQLIAQYKLVESKIGLTQTYRAASISSLSYTPEKQLNVLELERLELAKYILKARVSVWREAVELQRLTLAPSINELFVTQ